MASFICPGNGHIWMFKTGASGSTHIDRNSVVKLPGIVSWELTVDVEEATSIRTSDTNGVKVKPCGDTTEWGLDITCAIDPEDWIYSYILKDPGEGEPLNPGSTRSAWLFLTWSETYKLGHNATNSEIPTNNGSDWNMNQLSGKDDGIYVYGQFNPPGIGVDNDASDANTSDFSYSISDGPYMPRTQNGVLVFPDGNEDITAYDNSP